MRSRLFAITTLALLPAGTLLADFQYQETTKLTGGFLAGMARFAGKQATEPTTSTTSVKGNRMSRISARTGQIIDLDKGTITSIDFEKKTYSVMTFEQMKQAMEEAAAKMQSRSKDQKNDPKAPDVSFKASVKQTGQSKDIEGRTAQEYILILSMVGTDKQSGQSGGLNMTNDMWMAPEIAGYQEVRDFERRMAEKFGSAVFGGGNPMAAMRPEMGKGMAQMAEEMSKLKGIPILTVTRMGSTADGQPLPAASEAPELSQSKGPDTGDLAGRAAGGAANSAAQSGLGRLGGLAGGGLGGFGGFGRKKKQQDQPQDQPPQETARAEQPKGGPGAGLLLETTSQKTGFSAAAVDSGKFEVPAGFKQVQSEFEKHNK